MRCTGVLLLCLKMVAGSLWKNGIVHYSISSKDYDVHSQDVIVTTLSKLQKEICLKFFQAPRNFNTSDADRILYISNPSKLKTCPVVRYDFSKDVVDMPIGYKCLNEQDIARIVVDMLRASINPSGPSIINYDLASNIGDKKSGTSEKLISSDNRNYINTNYYAECGRTSQPSRFIRRRTFNESDSTISLENVIYYSNKLWPLGVVLFGIDDDLSTARPHDYKTLMQAMATIEQNTCIVFQRYIPDGSLDGGLDAKSYIWFGKGGEEMPFFGFGGGKQSIKLSSFIHGAPGHTAHGVNNLFRILGIHMMSNRYDRDNYVTINWDNVEKGKEHYLERAPENAWIASIPYDFDSVTHAPANYMCSNCDLGDTTVQPLQVSSWSLDHLWQRTISIGHRNEMSDSDIQMINLLYSSQCNERYSSVK